MDTIRKQSLNVRFDYSVAFTENLFAPDRSLLIDLLDRDRDAPPCRMAFLVDDGVARAWPDLLERIAAYAAAHAEDIELAASPLIVAGGESAKNDPGRVSAIHAWLLDARLDRHSYVVAIGGGAMLDLVGFASATFHRGVRHIRLPTTTLAQGDSGVGVKNGINAFGTKNLLGTFTPPHAVINDGCFIRSLSNRHCRAGLSEAVKVALVRDAGFFDWLEAHAPQLGRREPDSLSWAIRRSAELHMEHIAAGGDPFERGTARPLDYGHWSAHKLETLSKYELLHGEAVAIGIALDVRYAVNAGTASVQTCERVCRLLEALGFCLWHPALEQQDRHGDLSLLQGLADFREHLGGRLHLIMITDIARTVSLSDPDRAHILSAIGWLRERQAGEWPSSRAHAS